jgi:hypothetical protein
MMSITVLSTGIGMARNMRIPKREIPETQSVANRASPKKEKRSFDSSCSQTLEEFIFGERKFGQAAFQAQTTVSIIHTEAITL